MYIFNNLIQNNYEEDSSIINKKQKDKGVFKKLVFMPLNKNLKLQFLKNIMIFMDNSNIDLSNLIVIHKISNESH